MTLSEILTWPVSHFIQSLVLQLILHCPVKSFPHMLEFIKNRGKKMFLGKTFKATSRKKDCNELPYHKYLGELKSKNR